MNLNLKDKTIIVAGGLGGIGQQTVLDLIEEGAKVIVLTQGILNSKSINNASIHHIVNYQSDNELSKLFSNLIEEEIPIGLISFIGTGRAENITFQSDDDTDKLWEINYFNNRNIVKSFVKAIKEKDINKNTEPYFITLTSSIASNMFLNCPTEYTTSKAALERLCKELSWKLSPDFRVNCISPGNIYFKGGTWDKIKSEGIVDVDDLLTNKVPSGRFGTPKDISSIATFLSSPLATFINGACIRIDGGQSISN